VSEQPLVVHAPVAGRVVPLSDVPDLVFAEEMVGPGVAVEPDPGPGTAVAPVDGRVVVLHAHAFVVQSAGGRGVLVHLGIDTVQLEGEGFELLAAVGDEVTAGTPVVRWDPSAVAAAGRAAVCPVVALDALPTAVERLAGERAEPGTALFRWS
jgi:glucose-specific phosphotransferase system IIA component